ncbi:hypothetical protein, partial [Xanthomonas phaseoli]
MKLCVWNVLFLLLCAFDTFAAEPPNGGNFSDEGVAFAACKARGEWWLAEAKKSVAGSKYDCRPEDEPPESGVFRLWLAADMPFAPTSRFV